MPSPDYLKYPLPYRSAQMLRKARETADILGLELTQTVVGKMLSIQPRTVGRIERGQAAGAPFALIAALAALYGIRMDDLVHDRVDRPRAVELEHAIHQLRHILDSDQKTKIIDEIKTQAKKNGLKGDLEFLFGVRPELNLK